LGSLNDNFEHLLIPPVRGTYALILALEASQVIQIGRLGFCRFAAGCYIYVGSARGPGGLAGRLRHHVGAAARPHWHIDYLRRKTALRSIWFAETDINREHDWARLLAQFPGVSLPVKKFGASDCLCPAHLFYVEHPLAPSFFQDYLAREFPDDRHLKVVLVPPV
jgi:Uri superfamily endonuclease